MKPEHLIPAVTFALIVGVLVGLFASNPDIPIGPATEPTVSVEWEDRDALTGGRERSAP